jgi:hypothetical protein
LLRLRGLFQNHHGSVSSLYNIDKIRLTNRRNRTIREEIISMRIVKMAEDLYTDVKVDLEVYLGKGVPEQLKLPEHDYELKHDQKASVQFAIDMEARSWGISSIYVSPRQIYPISFSIVTFNGAGDEVILREGEITVDAYKIKTQHDPTRISHIGVSALYLVLLADGSVDYNQSYLETMSI